jgi:hypothetical protein
MARLSFNANILVDCNGKAWRGKDLRNNDEKNVQDKRENRLSLMFTFSPLGGRIIFGLSFRKAALPVAAAVAGMLEPRNDRPDGIA